MHFKKQSLPTKIKTLTIPSDCADVKQELLLISSKKKKKCSYFARWLGSSYKSNTVLMHSSVMTPPLIYPNVFKTHIYTKTHM